MVSYNGTCVCPPDNWQDEYADYDYDTMCGPVGGGALTLFLTFHLSHREGSAAQH
jgi:hypothetical protein